MTANERKFIVVEGPIGVGKTTLAKRLAETFGYQPFLEQIAGNPFLTRFYMDRRAMALPTQLFFLLQRARQFSTLRQVDMFQSGQVADFLFQKDQLFAAINLDDDEYALYQQVCARLSVEPPVPDLVVYLQAAPATLARRVAQRGMDFERALAHEYLEKVCAAYVEFFYHYDASPLLIVNTDDFDLTSGAREYQLLLEHMRARTSGRQYLNPS